MVHASPPSGQRAKLIEAAERLYSEMGPGVALRDIAKAAGQRNNSAVSYHFGSREGLVDAVLALRGGAMEETRLVMLSTMDQRTATIPELVRVLLEPTLVTPYRQGSTHYARFLEAIRSYRVVADGPRGAARWPGTRRLLSLIEDRLGELTPGSRRLRVRSLGTAMFAIAADIERDREAGRRPPRIDELVDMLSAMVAAGTGGAAGGCPPLPE